MLTQVRVLTFEEEDIKIAIDALREASQLAFFEARYGDGKRYRRLREEIKARLKQLTKE